MLSSPEEDPHFGKNVVARFDLDGSAATMSPLPRHLHPDLASALDGEGMQELYSHQVLGLQEMEASRDIFICTPTASGKSLVYQLRAIDSWLKDPESVSLFVYPYKALAQDQLGKISELAGRLGFGGFVPEIYDGDTPQSRRRKIQGKLPPVLLTNPDMLHSAFLAYAENWGHLFKRLRLVVLDEAHVYRGVFGSHVHHLLWRLDRVLSGAGSSPRWVATSATVSDGGGFFKRLTGREAVEIGASGAPSPARRLYLLSCDGSPYTLACELMDRLLDCGARTLAFTKARRVTELVYSWLCKRNREYRHTVSSYRAGFLPSERRKIEQGFFSGQLKGVVSTSAMEVGIDVGGLDACIMVGYPGSLISLYQRVGRVGRGGREADIFLVTMPDALDQYFVRHPESLLGRPIEEMVLDPENRTITSSHLVCAARELPIEDGSIPQGSHRREALEALDRAGELVLDAEGVRWHTLRRNPHREMGLRSIGESYEIVGESGKAIGSIDGARVFRECHVGAIYLHQGTTYQVVALSQKDRKVTVRPENSDHYTEVRSSKETEILSEIAAKPSGACEVHLGRLKVTETLNSYVLKNFGGGEVIAEYPLDAPPIIFETVGFWVVIPPAAVGQLSEMGLHTMGGIHAIEHAMIGMFPLLAMADRWDLGGISYTLHPQVGSGAVFIYDAYSGGIGLSEKGYSRVDELLRATWSLVKDCECEAGCPGCIQSPKCGNGNRPLDKDAAAHLLALLTGEIPMPMGKDIRPRPSGLPGAPAPVAQPSKKTHGRLVVDLETQNLASEVGGWGNIRTMRLALAASWDLDSGEWRTYFEEEAEDLVEDMFNAELVIGFNIRRFDFEVLRAYTGRDLGRIRTVDLLDVIKSRLGFRISLGSLAESNFGEGKTADGILSVQYFREGRFDLVEAYCKKDVELTGRLYLKGLQEGCLLFRGKGGELLRVRVEGWKG